MTENLFLLTLGIPFFTMIFLGVVFFTGLKIKEKILSEMVKIFSLLLTFLTIVLFGITWHRSPSLLLLDYGNWISVGDYEFKIRFVVDLLGATFAFLSAALIGTIFKFSRNYLHREEGYFRFIFLMCTLLFGMLVVSFSRSLDQLFIGWELVGATSVLLISYFFDKPQPVVHAKKAIISYRLCDMGILAAYAWSHHYLHSTDFLMLPKLLSHQQGNLPVLFIGIFLVWASLAKAGQLPMSSWLPTAMEGPTPSSAIFYGALSVHLGPFLLLRFYEYFTHFPSLLVAIGFIGGASAIYATLVGRTRPDAKTMLAYATISQVGIIYMEIALGFTHFALFHIVTHASLRTYQFLRSNSLIQDFFENPVVEQNKIIKRKYGIENLFSDDFKKKVYVHALHAFHLDYFTSRFFDLLLWPMKTYVKWEEKWMEYDTRLLKLLFKRNK